MRTNTEERNKLISGSYTNLISAEVQPDDAIDKISKEYKIGKFYVRSILRSSGVTLDRKDKYDRKDNLSDRDRQIIEKIEQGNSPESVGIEFDITPTRVRQVVRDNVTNLKHVRIERTLSDIKDDVEKGLPYKDIISKYGEKTIREIKSNLGYNLFKTYKDKRDSEIVTMGKQNYSASHIAEKFGLCDDYVYSIWHANGIHKDTKKKMTPEERAERNRQIFNESRTIKLTKIAEAYGLSYTMVKLIVDKESEKIVEIVKGVFDL